MYTNYRHTDVYHHIEEHIKTHPDKIAVYVGERGISYADLWAESKKIASSIANHMKGQGARDEEQEGGKPVRIGVFMQRNEHVEASILAMFQLGCTYVPIDTETPVERIAFIAEDASLALFLTEESIKAQLPAGTPTLTIEQILAQDTAETSADLSTADDEAYIIYTSGTTGKPKGVPINYTNLHYYFLTVGREEHFHMHANSVILHYSSVNFDVSIIEIYSSLYYGATLVVVDEDERLSVKKVHKIIDDRKVTYMSLPPTMFNLFPDYNFVAMETACAGGEVMPPSLTERIGKRPYRFLNAYGPAECTPVSCVREMTSPDLWRNIGWPSCYAIFVAVDDNMQPVRPGEEGELLIGGPQVFNGYLNRPDLTKEKLIENPFADTKEKAPRLYRTGDIVRPMADGSYEFVGRRDSQIKIYGHRIELDEIVAQIGTCSEVRRAHVKVDDTGKDKHLVVFIQPEDLSVCHSNERIIETIASIKQQISPYLPAYMIPSHWNFIEEFPLTLNGKIDSKKLVNRPFSYIQQEKNEEITSDERIFMNKVCDVLDLPNISVHADLFDVYGMTSLQCMQISMELNVMGMQVPSVDIYKHRTIREITKHRDARLCYWYNDDDNTTKPVIITVSGYTSFGYMYTQWANRLTDQYSIFVIEYYHAILGNKKVKDIEELMVIYRQMVEPVVKHHQIACFAGMCIGGEHSLLLAQQLYADQPQKPPVIIMDGEIDRDTREETNAHLRFPFLSDEENDIRTSNDFTLMQTYPDFRYHGRVLVFLCRDFCDYFSWLDPDMTDEKAEGMRNAFDTFEERWLNYYPQAKIVTLPSDHANFWCYAPSIDIIEESTKKFLQEEG